MFDRSSARRWPSLAGLLTLALILPLCGVALTTVGTSAQNANPAATLRFVNAIAGGGPVDVLLDGSPIAQGLAFGTATEYASVPAGDHGIQVMQAGQDQGQPLTDQKETLDGGAAYNLIIGAQNNQYKAQLLQVNLDSVSVGQARYQFIQAAPDLTNLTLQFGDSSGGNGSTNTGNTTNGSGVGTGDFLAGGGYQEIDAGTYTLHVTNGGDNQPNFTSPTVTLDSGQVYDLVIIGQQSDQSLSILTLITQVLAPCGTQLGVGKPTDACARFIHVSPDAGAVDILIDGTAAAKSTSYGTATEFTALASGDHEIQIVPAGGSASAALIDQTVTFDAGQAYQFAIVGLAAENGDNGLKLHQDSIDLSPLPAGQARARLINAVSGGGNASATDSSGNKLFDNVGFNSASDYGVVNAGTVDLTFQVEMSGDQSPISVAGKGTEFKEGMVYDLFLIGNAADKSTVQLLVLTTQATVRSGAQSTPVSVVSPVPPTQASPVTAASATVVGGSPTTEAVGTAPVTPVVLTPTPTPAS